MMHLLPAPPQIPECGLDDDEEGKDFDVLENDEETARKIVDAGKTETSATPKRSIVEPTLDRQPTAMPIACMGVTPDKEMISMETKNVAMNRKK